MENNEYEYGVRLSDLEGICNYYLMAAEWAEQPRQPKPGKDVIARRALCKRILEHTVFESIEWEYGIRMNGRLEPHRAGMTRAEAETWLREIIDLGLPADMFSIIRRPYGSWEIVP